jgi:hypothetical protein
MHIEVRAEARRSFKMGEIARREETEIRTDLLGYIWEKESKRDREEEV